MLERRPVSFLILAQVEWIMRAIERTAKFKRDYRREKRTDPALDSALIELLQLLASGAPLPDHRRDHALAGEWSGYRDCHLKPDLVLIYARDEDVLRLVRLGSHSELFG